MPGKRRMDRSWVDDLPPDEIRALEQSENERPGCDALPVAISYSDRGPGDYVVSGPIGSTRVRGRQFDSLDAARNWVLDHYGARAGEVKWNLNPENPAWYVLVRRMS